MGRMGDGAVGALFVLDVDHFKDINDRLGHAAGDAVLTTVAHHLRLALRGTDMIVRWGGEEFLAFVPAVAGAGLDEVALRILHGVSAQPAEYRDGCVPVTVSVGFAPFPLALGGRPLTWEQIVNLADMALYQAKARGRNCACGVLGFPAAAPVPLDAIERDLEEAWRQGWVDLCVVPGAAEADLPLRSRA
jgi:diguanylate cyclase (GGDEF)-like protein